MTDKRVLILPGWDNSGPAHWQTRWERQHGYRRVEQDDWLWPRRGDWMARLEEVLLESSTPAVLAAHSLGCLLVAAWAAHSANTARVQAALLVAPPDVERDDLPPNVTTWRPIVRRRLPFATTVVLSSDDSFCTLDRGRGIAADWGARVVELGAAGHINGDSGLGDWPTGHALLKDLLGR
jgi:predicted alpha/beta hydrolase family esterase